VRRRLVPVISVVVGAALVALLVFGLAKQGSSRALDTAVQSGRQPAAPLASDRLPVLDGVGAASRLSLASLRGKVVVVNFWASWCPTCLAEAPLVERAHRSLLARGAGIVLGVDYKDVDSQALDYARLHGMTFPNVRDIDGSFASAYGTVALPETFVLDGHSRVVAISRGPVPSEAWLTHAIAAAERA